MRRSRLRFAATWKGSGFGVLMLLGSPVPTMAADASPPDTNGLGWTFKRLDLDVALQPGEMRMTIEGKATLRSDIDSSMGPSIGMNATNDVMRFVRVDASPGATVAINQPHPLAPQIRLAHIRYANPVSRGTEIEIQFACESHGRSDQFLVDEDGALASWAEAWYPVALFVPEEESYSRVMSAPGVTRIHLPGPWRSWRTVSNGEFRDRAETADGVTEIWEASIPAARSFAAGPYKVLRYPFKNHELSAYVHPSGSHNGRAQAEAIAEAIGALEARFGAYPYPIRAVVEVPEGPARFLLSCEWGLIFAKSRVFAYGESNLPAFAHEAAHGWWGILVNTRGPGSSMCDEALAQYGSVIAIEGVKGEHAATDFLRFASEDYVPIQCARGYFEMWRKGQDKPLSELSDAEWEQNLARAKGTWVYHMLRRRVGDDLFFEVLRGFILDFSKRQPLALDDVRSAFIAAAPPEAQLERFFEQWLDQPGAPILDFDLTAARGRKDKLVIRQIQDGKPYQLKLDVAVDSTTGPMLQTIEIDDRVTRVTLNGSGSPTGVRLDPDHHLLIWTQDYGPRPKPAPHATP